MVESVSDAANGAATGHHFPKLLVSLLEQYPPGVSDHFHEKDAKSERWPPKKDQGFMDRIELSPDEMSSMRRAHDRFLSTAERRLPRYAPLATGPTDGIVMVGGGSYFPPLMVSLRMLRRTGTTLPVEIFLPEDEYEQQLCEAVLPTLHAKCVTFESRSSGNISISHYQYKVFAILFSSFENILWVDADVALLQDASILFSAPPFVETGLVTWPDIWRTTISPLYYNISSQPATPVMARASSETGQLLVSKSRHWKTLLLAAYYNYYGPGKYYSLLCQGGAGCGDKDTFLPAAGAVGLPFYDVKAAAQPVGHFKTLEVQKKSKNVFIFALIQGDPAEDYEITQHLEKLGADRDSETDYDRVRPFFLHMSMPKWDARTLLSQKGTYDVTRGPGRARTAAFKDPPSTAAKIRGVERMVWEETRWVACHLEYELRSWQGQEGQICKNMEAYFSEFLDARKGAKLGLGKDDALLPALQNP